MAEERTGFLGRWARRKTDALQGRPLEEPVTAPKPTPATAGTAALAPAPKTSGASAAPPVPADAPQPPEKLLSLDDVKTLTQDCDFKPFMSRNVGSDVRNAAMKKLFTDPHYNVMDGLDIYIDDYSLSDPIPESMLRQMASAQFLNLFADAEKGDKDSGGARPVDEAARLSVESPDHPLPETVALCANLPHARSPDTSCLEHSSQPEPLESSGASPQDDHAHSHLRLQPDHAPSAPPAGGGAS